MEAKLTLRSQDRIAADDPDMDLKRVYSIMYRICRLKSACQGWICERC